MAQRGEFVDENLPWPLWRPIAGTLAGALVLVAWSLASPVDSVASATLGSMLGRTALVFVPLYFPAYSRRGWGWKIGAFALLLGTAWLTNNIAVSSR